jgi:hypothetical protein
MIDSRSPDAPGRLELAVARLLTAIASLRAPAVWCFTFAVALNALVLIVRSWNSMLWTVPLIAGCGLFWLFIARTVVRLTMPSDLSVRKLLEGLGFVGAATSTSTSDSKLGWVLCIPLVLTLIPGWIGAVTTAAVLIAAVWFVHRGQAGITRAATTLVMIGVALLAVSFVGTRAVSVTCGIIALLGLCVLAFGASGFDGIAKSFFRVEFVCAAAAVLAVLPLGVLGGVQNVTVLTLFVGGIIVPAGMLLATYILQQRAISRCRESTYKLRKSLESVADLPRCEDEVRESDGFYRVCEPRYSHAWSLAVGETGYIAWPEHDNLAFPAKDGEWCIARAITSTKNPLLSERDRIGEGVRMIFVVVADSVGKMVGDKNLQAFLSRTVGPWHLRVFRGQDEREYLKMPWESGEVLAIPRNFTISLVYPTGCGVVDQDGLPCEVRSVRVHLTLRNEVVADFDNEGQMSSTSVRSGSRPSRSLVWRAPLIIPAVYEGILRVLVAEMKEWRTLHQVDQASLLEAIAARSRECLEKFELSRLLSLQITSVDVVQSAMNEQDRDIVRNFHEFRSKLNGNKIASIRRFLQLAYGKVYVNNHFILKGKVDAAVARIRKEIDEGISGIDNAIAGGMLSAGSDSSQTTTMGAGGEKARTRVKNDSLLLTQALRDQREHLISALNEIEQAFGSTSKG